MITDGRARENATVNYQMFRQTESMKLSDYLSIMDSVGADIPRSDQQVCKFIDNLDRKRFSDIQESIANEKIVAPVSLLAAYQRASRWVVATPKVIERAHMTVDEKAKEVSEESSSYREQKRN